ncbi:ATP-binding protein [Sphingobium lactosutens]|nr:ATP-binding protein [Sphingobium lactosutens]
MPRGEIKQTGAMPLHFRISSALKRVIGRDLITDEFVAIFELVKNSFDAQAKTVEVAFVDGTLFITDDGKGMSFEDIENKWLFVAYSAKRDGSEDAADYRDKIGHKRSYAGSKGVGRFSCDRLGRKLRLQSRRAGDSSVTLLNVNWDLFEANSQDEFIDIPVSHSSMGEFDLPAEVTKIKYGTVLEIGGLREDWPRDKLLKLRAALAKLINPFGTADHKFVVNLTAPHEDRVDQAERITAQQKGNTEAVDIVNGPIKNFIFETLKGKTTHLSVEISKDGKFLYSELNDRGALIYKVREPNPYPLLSGSEFSSNLFYLNRSAKATFAVRMGVPSVQFGSIFLFKNGFRIFPIGEPGVDTFGIDRRKQQGYARFLGTRDVIGRIDISGDDEHFREATSRNQGLIDTPAYEQLTDCFDEMCLRRLERYVVGVNWKDPLDLEVEDTSRLKGDHASARITAIVTQLAGADGVELLDYNRELIRILNERSDEFSKSLSGLRLLAEKSDNKQLLNEIDAASTRFNELQRAEAAAREAADRERIARREAERQARDAALRADQATKSYVEERKRNLFLTSLSSLDRDTVEILHHQIVIHSAAINEIIEGQLENIRAGHMPSLDDLLTTFDNISFQNKKVLSTARFATKANFRLDSENIQEDLALYIEQYIEQVAPTFAETGIKILVDSEAKSLVKTFKPIEVAIVIDNLISNAGRADAGTIKFFIDQPSAKELRIVADDDGRGFSDSITDLHRLFEKGFTTSLGSGLGLYHVAEILDDMNGSIAAERLPNGARFVVRIRG